MNTLMKTNGNLFPTLLSDFFGASPVLSPNLFDVDLDLLPSRLGINVPTANISETEKEYQIQLAAPGLAKKDFKIETDNGVLTISAEKEEKAESKNGYARTEYSFNSFSRSFTLPENSKPDNINAKYEDGILKLTVPKKEITSVKPKKEIAVS
ncbi:MAG: Hsp20/alpha crystallin family protein [Bacteroidetes bacterium]|nr:Hsp20/alpha crystallin family protein [Bacteroidota bacterium]